MINLLLTVIFSFLLIAPAHAQKLKIIASFSILGDMVRQVAGDAVEVKTLVGPDGDAHVYEPKPSDAMAINHADLIIINSLGFEGWLPRLIASSGYHGPIVAAAEGITPLTFTQGTDPHAWQSVANGKIYVLAIRDALVKADSANASLYRTNAARYQKQLEALDNWIRSEINRVPPQKRAVITTHDAFHYFAQDYGVKFIAPLGVNTESDASAQDIAKLIDQIRQQKIHALFLENISDPRLMRQLKTDAGAIIGGTLYSDALSAPDGPAASYVALLQHNTKELVRAMLVDPHP